jgi:hypothetical protein
MKPINKVIYKTIIRGDIDIKIVFLNTMRYNTNYFMQVAQIQKQVLYKPACTDDG